MTGAKPLYRFRDRALAGLMAARGWKKGLAGAENIRMLMTILEILLIAADIAKEFLNQPTAATHEAIALIWVDGAGNVQRTGVHVGVPYWAPIELCYPEVDFANGGQIVGIIHSHSSHYQSGAGLSAVGNDIHALSNTDFDTLLGAANGKYGGFDNLNIRSYIAQNGAVQEYYAFDQDASQIGQDDSRTVDSVRSTDFYENAGQCACP